MKRASAVLLVVLLGAGLCGLGRDLALSVTEVDPGVRGVGLGGAGVAHSDGVEALYYNASRLAGLGAASLQSFYASHLGAADYFALGVAFPSFGVGYLSLSSGDVAGYDASGDPTGELRYRSTAFIVGFGASPQTLTFLPRLPFDWAIGVRGKILSTTLAAESGSGVAFDLAASLMFGSLSVGPVTLADFTVGVNATNLIGSIAYDNRSETLITDARLGISTVIIDQVLFAFDFELSGRIHLGVEYRPVPTLAVRVGVLQQRPGFLLSLGLGLDLEGFGLDYAYMSSVALTGSHRVALSVDFASINLGALTNALRRILP
ncbi:MAG: hypothetical protein JSW65_00255 [Candidatus Bipolaricaulota bacterium]|nr:MAG: hypothetical protein JSW65_00255 [Candidatus Bipolaricaulota bacterium]